jgi:hypothetical protein
MQALQIERNGFFNQNVPAGLGAGDTLFGVQMMRRADGDDLDVVVSEHRIQVRIRLAIPESMLGGLGFRASAVAAQNAHHLGVGILLESLNVLIRNPPRSENSYAQFVCHYSLRLPNSS